MAIKKKLVIALTSAVILSLGLITGCIPKINNIKSDQVVNVYSARNYEVDKIIYEVFEKKTGIRVNLVTGKASEILEQLSREGEDTQADIFLSADIVNLKKAIESDLTEPITSEIVDRNVLENLRGEGNSWIGLTARARAIAFNKEKVKKEELSTFKDLESEKWKGQVLSRSSDSLYSKTLLGTLIELYGEEESTKWASSIVDNFYRQPEGNDKEQIKLIASGQGSVAIISAHYIGCMLSSEDIEEKEAAENVGVHIPDDTSINISGAVLSKHSKNKENAIKLIEFFTGEKAQEALTETNYEYPVNTKVKINKELLSWGEVKIKNIDNDKICQNNLKATKIFENIGWE